MRNRLQRQVAQRTEMLAGVSHDLRTPLTRMKLQLAMMGDAQGISDLRDDVREMERMVEGYLAFARGEGTEQPARTNLREVLDDVTAAARRQGADITLSSEGAMTLTIRREAMRRCLANIVGNATRHAKRVEISARRAADMIEICIDDDGPGIPADQREAVFRPFQRLDQSRNAETGGVGLGLTIARDVVHGYGGEIFLEDSPLGGLRARIRLPV
jgi:two-component system osmolarity sensor histidine kinase EnvZ